MNQDNLIPALEVQEERGKETIPFVFFTVSFISYWLIFCSSLSRENPMAEQ